MRQSCWLASKWKAARWALHLAKYPCFFFLCSLRTVSFSSFLYILKIKSVPIFDVFQPVFNSQRVSSSGPSTHIPLILTFLIASVFDDHIMANRWDDVSLFFCLLPLNPIKISSIFLFRCSSWHGVYWTQFSHSSLLISHAGYFGDAWCLPAWRPAFSALAGFRATDGFYLLFSRDGSVRGLWGLEEFGTCESLTDWIRMCLLWSVTG